MIFMDIILIILLILGALEGWKKGLLTSVVKLVSSILIFALAIILKTPISLILIDNLPFFSFGGIFKDVTTLNIVLYEGIAFLICIFVLTLIFNILLKFTGILNKFINATIILGLPNKLGGAIVNTLRYFIIVFIIVFVISLIPQTSKYVKETVLANGILNNTPVLSSATKNLNKTITEIYDIATRIDKNTSNEEINREALQIMLKYGIVSIDSVNNLIETGKLDTSTFEDLKKEYNYRIGDEMIKYLKNDEEFESIISSGVTLVDFYADWCGPCRRMGEVLETLTEVNVLKINTDEFPNLATSFGVMSIPTLILFIDGAESGKLIGLQSKDDILDFINKK